MFYIFSVINKPLFIWFINLFLTIILLLRSTELSIIQKIIIFLLPVYMTPGVFDNPLRQMLSCLSLELNKFKLIYSLYFFGFYLFYFIAYYLVFFSVISSRKKVILALSFILIAVVSQVFFLKKINKIALNNSELNHYPPKNFGPFRIVDGVKPAIFVDKKFRLWIINKNFWSVFSPPNYKLIIQVDIDGKVLWRKKSV